MHTRREEMLVRPVKLPGCQSLPLVLAYGYHYQ